MNKVNATTKARSLCEQELISTQLQWNDCCFECQELKDKIEELTKKLKDYDKQLGKIRRNVAID
jgi:peptidoglycan hydrolase CwlO-like protein